MTDHVSACRCIWCASDPGKTATQDLHPLIRPVLAEQDYDTAGQPSEAAVVCLDAPDLTDLARLDGVSQG